jgi:hypothetical protein
MTKKLSVFNGSGTNESNIMRISRKIKRNSAEEKVGVMISDKMDGIGKRWTRGEEKEFGGETK